MIFINVLIGPVLWDNALYTVKIYHSYWFNKMLIGQVGSIGRVTRQKILGRGKVETQSQARHRGSKMPY